VSGVEADLTVSHNSGANELSATGGYSHQGFLDVNVTLGLSTPPSQASRISTSIRSGSTSRITR